MPVHQTTFVSRFYLKQIAAAALIVFLLWLVHPQQLWQALTQLTWPIVGYLALLSVLLIYISALKWQLFLQALGENVSVFRLFRLYVIGYFVNVAMPSYLGGDLVRSWQIGRRVGQHKALAATVMERFTGLAAMVVLALIFVWYVGQVSIQIKLVIVLIAAGLATVTAIALSTGLLDLVEKIKGLGKVTAHLRRIQEAFLLARRDRPLLLKTFGLSFLYHSVTVLNTVAAGFAVGWLNPPVWDLFVVLPLILLIGALPVAPSGLGIQEGAFYFFLTAIGATPAQALGVGVVLRAKSFILAAAGGLLWVFSRERSAPSDPA